MRAPAERTPVRTSSCQCECCARASGGAAVWCCAAERTWKKCDRRWMRSHCSSPEASPEASRGHAARREAAHNSSSYPKHDTRRARRGNRESRVDRHRAEPRRGDRSGARLARGQSARPSDAVRGARCAAPPGAPRAAHCGCAPARLRYFLVLPASLVLKLGAPQKAVAATAAEPSA